MPFPAGGPGGRRGEAAAEPFHGTCSGGAGVALPSASIGAAVGPESADHEEEGSRAHRRREDEPEVGRVSDLEGRKRRGYGNERVADRGEGSAQPEQAELPSPQDVEAPRDGREAWDAPKSTRPRVAPQAG